MQVKQYCASGAVHESDQQGCESSVITSEDWLQYRNVKLCNACRAPPAGKDTWPAGESKEGCHGQTNCKFGGFCVYDSFFTGNVRHPPPGDKSSSHERTAPHVSPCD